MPSGHCGRWACAALLAGTAVFLGATRAAAQPAAIQPVAPARVASPAVGATGDPGPAPAVAAPEGLPCLPVVCSSFSSDAVTAMANDVFGAFSTFLAHGVADVLDQIASAVTSTANVDLNASWFQGNFNAMRSLAVLVLLPMMLVGLMSAVIRRDAAQLWRAGGVYVPVAILGGVALIALTEKALQVSDWASNTLTGNVTTANHAAVEILKDAVLQLAGQPSLGTALAMVVLFIALFGALLIWIELLLRTAAIYLVVLFLPLAMSGLVWKGTMQWTRKMLETLVALILSKFVIVVVLALGASMVTANDGIGTVMEGTVLLLMAAFAPFAVLRLVPIVEAGAIGHLEGLERRPIAAATRAATTAVQLAMMSAGGGAGGAALADNGGDAGIALEGRREAGGQLGTMASSPGGPDCGPDGGPDGGPDRGSDGLEPSPSSGPSPSSALPSGPTPAGNDDGEAEGADPAWEGVGGS